MQIKAPWRGGDVDILGNLLEAAQSPEKESKQIGGKKEGGILLWDVNSARRVGEPKIISPVSLCANCGGFQRHGSLGLEGPVRGLCAVVAMPAAGPATPRLPTV